MSGDELAFTGSDIRANAAQIRAVAQSFDRLQKGFQGEVGSHGNPFGGDDLGGVLSESHQYVFDSATRCFESNVNGLHSHADHLEAMAATYDGAEQANVDGARNL